MSLILGAVRLCKWSVRLRARLSRLLTGRRVHNMSPTQPARQPAETLTENRGVGWTGGVGWVTEREEIPGNTKVN